MRGSLWDCEPGCTTDGDCSVDEFGSRCLLDAGGYCGCASDTDCPNARFPFCAGGECSGALACSADSDCPAGLSCDPTRTCHARCDDGGQCLAAQPNCDVADVAGNNGEGVDGADPGAIWCYECRDRRDCPVGLACLADLNLCVQCDFDSDCTRGVCLTDSASGDRHCHDSCDAGPCATGEVCDDWGQVSGGFCFGCLSPVDCPGDQGCNGSSHTCGSCLGPNAMGGPFDCPPDDICSNYWVRNSFEFGLTGACLPNCDERSCPADRPICAVLPGLTFEHKYCFGCLQDSDCASLGAGAWCDTSVGLTFTCQPPP